MKYYLLFQVSEDDFPEQFRKSFEDRKKRALEGLRNK